MERIIVRVGEQPLYKDPKKELDKKWLYTIYTERFPEEMKRPDADILRVKCEREGKEYGLELNVTGKYLDIDLMLVKANALVDRIKSSWGHE